MVVRPPSNPKISKEVKIHDKVSINGALKVPKQHSKMKNTTLYINKYEQQTKRSQKETNRKCMKPQIQRNQFDK